MKRTIKILLSVIVIVSSFSANSQQLALQDFNKISASQFSISKSSEKKYVIAPTLPVKREYMPIHGQNIPVDNYTRNFGFFCKEELQLQKRSGLNFSLRLGTLDYCNMLEGKNKAIISR